MTVVMYLRTFRIACSDVAAIVEGPPRHLIESLASAIADTILQRHPLVQVRTDYTCWLTYSATMRITFKMVYACCHHIDICRGAVASCCPLQAASIRVDKPQAPVVGMFDTIGEQPLQLSAIPWCMHTTAHIARMLHVCDCCMRMLQLLS
jgi:hypothetical protein